METIILPIEDELDLHTFQPKEIPELLEDYISECIKTGIFSVRLIHGKGTGILKKRVEKILEKDLRVDSFKTAPLEAGGWGAIIVELKRNYNENLVTRSLY
ncbi:MAG: Smr/MutS family protein [Desulfobacterales bacterium]|nr:Smr/MutS family protein [Desulfobacterales bacterium]